MVEEESAFTVDNNFLKNLVSKIEDNNHISRNEKKKRAINLVIIAAVLSVVAYSYAIIFIFVLGLPDLGFMTLQVAITESVMIPLIIKFTGNISLAFSAF